SKEKYPELYKKTGRLFNKDTTKFAKVITNYAKENLSPSDATNMLNFLNGQGKENLQPSKIKDNLPKICGSIYIREAEFALALQGEKIEKKDIFKVKDSYSRRPCSSAISKVAEYHDKNYLLLIGEVMHDAGTPITKKDLTEQKIYYKCGVPKNGIYELKGRVIAISAINGSLEQVKDIVEINGEKLGKKDLMLQITEDERHGTFRSKTNESIVSSSLRSDSFDTVEKILTEEGTFLSVNDVLSDFTQREPFDNNLGKLLTSPVFKDSTKNIEEMWKQLPDNYKNSTENQQAYNIAIGKANDLKKKTEENRSKAEAVAKALNKGNIAAMKSKAGR
ncbi:MAG: hypothetical protein KAJ75_07800, partial [Alphaproteobacteria bacterium]|nr:hypothetical protein [Alphaproteobacteria bacterium]